MRVGFVRTTGIAAALAVGLTSLMFAAADPVADRQAAMKDIGQSMKDAAGLNSPATFDAAKAKAVMGKIAADVKTATSAFPAGSDKDAKSQALPAVWTASADFNKRMVEFATLATAASNAADAAAYAPAFKAVGATCKSCHDTYRKKPS